MNKMLVNGVKVCGANYDDVLELQQKILEHTFDMTGNDKYDIKKFQFGQESYICSISQDEKISDEKCHDCKYCGMIMENAKSKDSTEYSIYCFHPNIPRNEQERKEYPVPTITCVLYEDAPNEDASND